jgi:hypothetical protein
MPPKAQLRHRTDGRIRVYIPSKRHSVDYFKDVEEKLLGFEPVEAVDGNPVTGSVLIFHRGPDRPVLEYSRKRGLFEVTKALPEMTRNHSREEELAERTMHKLRSSDVKAGLSALSVVGLLGVAAYQASKGRLFPPAWSMLMDAIRLVRRDLT